VTALTRYLHARGIRTTVRNSAGQDVDGGCGQLRARNLENRQPSAKITLHAAGENGSAG
jgi:adenine C2-methylase RlmN of 23S rRNA A2503 and tRNA A37